MAQLDYAIPITPFTVFHVTYASKQFTCYTILLLAVDDNINCKYIRLFVKIA